MNVKRDHEYLSQFIDMVRRASPKRKISLKIPWALRPCEFESHSGYKTHEIGRCFHKNAYQSFLLYIYETI